jgi:hypothetical protein
MTISIAFKRRHGGLPAGESHGGVRLERTKPCLARFQLLTSANEGLKGARQWAFRQSEIEEKDLRDGRIPVWRTQPGAGPFRDDGKASKLLARDRAMMAGPVTAPRHAGSPA